MRWEYKTTLPASWETCVQVKKQQLEPEMEQKTGSKLGKKDKIVHCQPAYLTSIQSTLCENHNMESSLLEEISTTSDIQMIPL